MIIDVSRSRESAVCCAKTSPTYRQNSVKHEGTIFRGESAKDIIDLVRVFLYIGTIKNYMGEVEGAIIYGAPLRETRDNESVIMEQ